MVATNEAKYERKIYFKVDNMIDLLLTGIIVALILLLAWERYETRKEQGKLINALVSKTPEQLRDLEFVDKVQTPKVNVPQEQLDELNNLSDEKWKEVITEGV